MTDRPDLAAALADPASVPADQVADVLGALERARAVLWSRVNAPAPTAEDRLLTVDQAAERFGVTRDWLRRRPTLPFVVRLSEGVVRYSSRGIDQYIAAQRAASLTDTRRPVYKRAHAKTQTEEGRDG